MTTPLAASAVRGPGLFARLFAEALGTLFLVIAALGVPLFTIPQSNPLPGALAAGLAVTAAMLAFGRISGGHFNPAITLGNLIAGRIGPLLGLAYLGAQVLGGLLGSLTLFGIVRTVPGINDSRQAFDTVASGFGEHSTIQAHMAGVLLVEVVGAALLVAVFLGTTTVRSGYKMAAPVAVGLTTAVLLQLGQSIGNAPFNPARATASALFSSAWAVEQLWLFWVAPLAGATLAGLIFRGLAEPSTPVTASMRKDGADEDSAHFPREGSHAGQDGRDTELASTGDADAGSAESGSTVAGPAGTWPEKRGTKEKPRPDEAQDFFDGKRS